MYNKDAVAVVVEIYYDPSNTFESNIVMYSRSCMLKALSEHGIISKAQKDLGYEYTTLHASTCRKSVGMRHAKHNAEQCPASAQHLPSGAVSTRPPSWNSRLIFFSFFSLSLSLSLSESLILKPAQ